MIETLRSSALWLHELGHCSTYPSLVGRTGKHGGFCIGPGIDSSPLESLDSMAGAIAVDYYLDGRQLDARLRDILRWAREEGPNRHDARAAIDLIRTLSDTEAVDPIVRGMRRAGVLVARASVDNAWRRQIDIMWQGLCAGEGLVVGESLRITHTMSGESWCEVHSLPPWTILEPIIRGALDAR